MATRTSAFVSRGHGVRGAENPFLTLREALENPSPRRPRRSGRFVPRDDGLVQYRAFLARFPDTVSR